MEITVHNISAEYNTAEINTSVVALPVLHLQHDRTTYAASTPSLLKHLTRSGITATYLSEPDSLFEQRSIDWFGPSLMILHSVYTANPDIFKVVLDAILSHTKQLYPSDSKPNLRFSIIMHEDDNSRTTDVQYEGDPTHFPELLKTLEKTWKKK